MVNTSITWIEEVGRGLLGKPAKFTHTAEGNLKATFDLGIGKNDPQQLIFTLWRKCIAYGELAENLRHVALGNLFEFHGFLKRQPKRDNKGQVIISEGNILTEEKLIVHKQLKLIPKSEWKKEDSQIAFPSYSSTKVAETV